MIWVAVVITMLLFILVAKPTGIYLEKAFQGSKRLDKVFGPFEKLIFKITGVKNTIKRGNSTHYHSFYSTDL